jgi:anti-sigma regulatory factor (Ser/Thr protein kinase)
VVSESFAPEPSEVGAARHFAITAAAILGCHAADLSLVVSELATNACVHARSPFTVSLNRLDTGLLVEVEDGDPAPATMQPLALGTSGRGMQIVSAIARDWGISGNGTGKSVWAILDC